MREARARERARTRTQQKPLFDKSVAQRRASKREREREKAGPNGGFAASQTVICLLQRLPRFRVPSASQVSAFTLPRVIKIGSEADRLPACTRVFLDLDLTPRALYPCGNLRTAELTLQFFLFLSASLSSSLLSPFFHFASLSYLSLLSNVRTRLSCAVCQKFGKLSISYVHAININFLIFN